jgi:hypothetical protein
MVRTWAYTIAESVCQREAPCNAQFIKQWHLWNLNGHLPFFSLLENSARKGWEPFSGLRFGFRKLFFFQWSSIISLLMKCLATLTVCSGRPYEHVHPIRIAIRPLWKVEPVALLKWGNGDSLWWGTIISLPLAYWMTCLETLAVCSGTPYEHAHPIRIAIRPLCTV